MLPPLHVLARHKCGAGESEHTFSGINTLVAAWDTKAGITSRHLVLLINGAGAAVADYIVANMQLNGDTGNNYNRQYLHGEDAAPSAGISGNDAAILGLILPAANYSNAFGGGFYLIPHAFGGSNHKAVLALSGGAEVNVFAVAGRWASTAAITSLLIKASTGDFASGTILLLCVVDERYCIGESLLSGADGLFSFSGISQRDGNLCTIGYLRSDRASTNDGMKYEINDDAVTTNYWRQRLEGDAANAAAARDNTFAIGTTVGDNGTANAFSGFLALISAFAKANNDPHALSLSGFHESSGPKAQVRIISGRRDNVAAVTKVAFKPVNGTNFKDGSGMWLYRIPSPREFIAHKMFNVDGAELAWDKLDGFTSDFEALLLSLYARSDEAAVGDEAQVSLNEDTTAANYDSQELTGTDAVIAAARSAASRNLLYIPADSEGANEFGGGHALIPAYAETDRHKHLLALHGQQENNVAVSSHRWENTAAVTKIALDAVGGSNLKGGTIAELSGLVPLGKVIRRKRDRFRMSQLLRPTGRAWRD